MKQIDIRFGELCLKGNNIGFFESTLIKNIKNAMKQNRINGKLIRKHKHLLLETKEVDACINILQRIFGIRYFRIGNKIERDEKILRTHVLDHFKDFDKTKTFKVHVNRADKKYKKTSVELAKELGLFVEKELNLQGNILNPNHTLIIDILEDGFFIAENRFEGLGGLPIGTTGKVLCLISGGIDSPVSAWMMMKRGCTVVLYTVSCVEDKEIKIIVELKSILEKYCPQPIKLIHETYSDFSKKIIKLAENKMESYNCLYFKYYLLKRAEEIAKQEHALGLVTGDNLAQVASQTLQNLNAQRLDTKMPVYSPLIGFDKEEIIDLSKKIGLFDISIRKKEDYFFLPKNPIIHTNINKFKEVLNLLDSKKPI